MLVWVGGRVFVRVGRLITNLDLLPHQPIVPAVDPREKEEQSQPGPCGKRHEAVEAVEEKHPADELWLGSVA